MEDDNAMDIIKWLFKEGTNVDMAGVFSRKFDGVASKWEAKLRGNLLAMKPIDIAAVPQLWVCEKIQLHKDNNDPLSFELKYGDERIRLSVATENEAERWLLKLATCSHRMIQADLDQVMQKYYAETTRNSPVHSRKLNYGALSNYFLTSPFEKESSFYIYQSVGIPNRIVVCKEIICESKMSLVIPPDMLKMMIGWASQLRDELRVWSTMGNSVILSALSNAVRQLNSNIEVYTQGVEFLNGYVGPCFRPSQQRYRIAFAAVPTNLHAQYFQINSKPAAHFLTSGAVTAAPLRFAMGGLYRMKNKFVAGLDSTALDATNEYRFQARRKTLLNAKREIGDMTKRIDSDWHVGTFGIVDRVGVEMFSQLKQLHGTVCDIIHSFPNVHNLADALCVNGYARLAAVNALPDMLANQLECLDASLISLTSKMAAIDIVNDDSEGRVSLEESAKVALHATLDILLQVVDSVLAAQLISLLIALRRPADGQLYFAIQLRQDLLLSQAVSIVTTALLASLQELTEDERKTPAHRWSVVSPLVSCFAFLSCYGDERGMIEDSFETWSTFYNHVQFRYVEAFSSVSETCIPQIEGSRTDLRVSIPLPSPLFKEKLSKVLGGAETEWFRVETLFWNIGVNHEATLACSLGDISLEENVNRTALDRLQNYINKYYSSRETTISGDVNENVAMNRCDESRKLSLSSAVGNDPWILPMMSDLRNTVNACPSRKNVSIFHKVVGLVNALDGLNIVSCKSGKDRTAMAVTLEEGRSLKETCGISQHQIIEIIDCLRRDGVRRENCRKNIGKAIYSFSPFQMHFLPKEFRPPNGTYAQVSS